MAEVEITPAVDGEAESIADVETPPVTDVESKKSDDQNHTSQKRANGDAEEDFPPAKKVKDDHCVKSDAPPNDTEKKIIRQIEYYFGDINLSRDKFMQEKIAEDNGWITLETMLTFKRLASISTDSEVIRGALAKSETQLVQTSDDGLKLRRAPELPIPEYNEERRKELSTRTAYVKGIPTDKTVEEILVYFEDKPNVENVQRRSYLDKATKKFVSKGSLFVVFKTVEDCKNFIESGPYKFDGVGPDLILKWQQDYIDEQKKEREKLKQEQIQHKRANKEAAGKEKDIPDCSIIHMSGFSAETTWEDIKSKLTDLEVDVAYVEFSKGQTEGHVRLQGQDAGESFIKTLTDNQVEIKGVPITVRVLTGEEFEKHKQKIKAGMFETRNKRQLQWKYSSGKNKGGKKRKGGSRN